MSGNNMADDIDAIRSTFSYRGMILVWRLVGMFFVVGVVLSATMDNSTSRPFLKGLLAIGAMFWVVGLAFGIKLYPLMSRALTDDRGFPSLSRSILMLRHMILDLFWSKRPVRTDGHLASAADLIAGIELRVRGTGDYRQIVSSARKLYLGAVVGFFIAVVMFAVSQNLAWAPVFGISLLVGLFAVVRAIRSVRELSERVGLEPTMRSLSAMVLADMWNRSL